VYSNSPVPRLVSEIPVLEALINQLAVVTMMVFCHFLSCDYWYMLYRTYRIMTFVSQMS